MNTQNVNTAASEASKTWMKSEKTERTVKFFIEAEGALEYSEEDARFGTFFMTGSIALGEANTVSSAVAMVDKARFHNEWNLSAQNSAAISFTARRIIIRDFKGRVVLQAYGPDCIWAGHITDDEELAHVQAEILALRKQSTDERRADNYSTARELEARAEKLAAGIVDIAWRGHPEVEEATPGAKKSEDDAAWQEIEAECLYCNGY